MRIIGSIDEALAAVGEPLGVSGWKTVTQGEVNAFAEVTGDHQWVHVDVERAAAESPYGATIAHGYLTLSLIPVLGKEIYAFENRKLAINYGLERVRFIAPVIVGSRIRVSSQAIDGSRVKDDTVSLTMRHTVELEGSDRPAAVAEAITRVVY